MEKNLHVIVYICIMLASDISAASLDTLQLVQVLYRHGDRNIVSSYPNDPYKDASFWPEGFGQLTNVGKMQQYHLGLYLRERYRDFLPVHYSPDTIYVRSSDIDRTLMSAMSNLAGLFPPDKNQTWNPDLNWQPIPVHTVPENQDYLLRIESDCPRYFAELEKVKNSPALQKVNKENKALYAYLEKNSGDKVSDPKEVEYLHNTLFIENLKGYTLPNWTRSVFPEKLTPLADLSFSIPVFTKELQRFRGGPLIKEMLGHMKQKRNSTLRPERQMFMYSGHDTSVSALLMALGLFSPPRAPPYTAMVMVELHKNSTEEYAVKILYRNDSTVDPYVMTMPGCTELCPLDLFEELLKPVIPGNLRKECQMDDQNLFLGLTLWAILLAGIFIMVLFVSVILGLVYWKKKKSPAYWYLKLDTEDAPINATT